MARFDFTNIDLSSAADIRVVMQNFNKIEKLGITSAEVDSRISSAKTEVNNSTNIKLKDYTKTANLGALALKNYSYGKNAPSGGSDGDIYDQYF